jgi:hypothetical protein
MECTPTRLYTLLANYPNTAALKEERLERRIDG